MTNAPVASGKPSATTPDLGQLRTIMAADRTLMAWTRTSLSLLSFSFTIYKVLQGIEQPGKVLHPHAPRNAGLFLAGMGVLSMVLGSIQYRLTIRQLQKLQPFPHFYRIPAVMAGLLAIIGVGLFVGIALHRV
jgi:putative membrane protein